MDTAYDPFHPQKLDEMAGDWERLQVLLTQPEPPHLVLVGPAGVGKSCALRLVLGSAITVWLRCSQDPTLRDNRDRIKAAARRRVEAGQINWIVLEHADALHADAQAFLRRIIETSMGSSRFVLEVRDAAAIAEPLLSRTMLFTTPRLMDYEVRAEVMRRSPSLSLVQAEVFAKTCDGNIRWAVLQGLGSQGLGSQGLGSQGFLGVEKSTPTSWSQVLKIMESIQATGSSPRAWAPTATWDRPGGICPWSLLALELSKSV
jgi:hypothetical protein